jgi:reverse transcriptase-like protein
MYPDVPSPAPYQPEPVRQDEDSAQRRAIKAVASGRLSKATQLLTSGANVAPPSEATIAELRRLHPVGPDGPFGDRAGSQGPQVTLQHVRTAVNSTSFDTAGGPSGWTTSLLKTASKSPDFLQFLTTLANLIAQGTAPGRRLLLSSSLVPLQKAGAPKIRPIAIGEHFYRIAAKALARNFRNSNDLSPCQLGVGTAGGVEPIVWKVQETVDDPTRHGAFLLLDLANAFNSIDRRHLASAVLEHNRHLFRAARWAYGSPSPLLMRTESGRIEELLGSSQGVRQGDPLGPLLFSYAYRQRIERLTALLAPRGAEVMAYLDDTVVWLPHDVQNRPSPRAQAQAALDDITADFNADHRDGLTLNVAKCKIQTTGELHVSGVEFLGTCVGTEDFRRTFLTRKIQDMRRKTRRILRLPRQAAFLLLQQCVAPTLMHLLRTLDSTELHELWTQATEVIQDASRSLAAVPALDDTARIVATLPIRLGGLGLPDYSFLLPHARASSRELTRAIQTFLETFQHHPTPTDLIGALPPTPLPKAQQARGAALLDTLEDHRRIAMVENMSKLGSAWARMTPIYPSRTLSDRQFSSALANRLLISSEAAGQCSSCHQTALFQHGDVCEIRRQIPGQTRHNRFRDLLAMRARQAGSTAVTEHHADAPRSNPLLRGDLLVTGPAAPDGIVGVVDITFTAPSSLRNLGRSARLERLPGESVKYWTTRQLSRMLAVRDADKRRKYDGAFLNPFTPVVISTGGFLSSTSKAWFKRLDVFTQGKMASAFDLSVALVRARAASLL